MLMMSIYWVEAHIRVLKQNTEDLVVSSKQIGVAVNAEEANQMAMSCGQHPGQNHNIPTVRKSSEWVEQVSYLGTTLTNQNQFMKKI
jgi:hypothetical protein